MLVSHKYKFIYIKNRKVAGSSTEGFLQQFCAPPSLREELSRYGDSVPTIVTDYGIISGRNNAVDSTLPYREHMYANKIKKTLGAKIFNNYTKICSVRNPYDRAVSLFWHLKREAIKNNLNDNYNDFDKIKKLFINSFSNKEWTDKKYKTLSDWDRYTLTDIKKKKFPICNFYIKYESINDDLKKLCNILKIKENVMLPEFKTNYRKNDKKYQDYYDEKTKKFIYNLCKNEIKFHKYGF